MFERYTEKARRVVFFPGVKLVSLDRLTLRRSTCFSACCGKIKDFLGDLFQTSALNPFVSKSKVPL